MKWLRITTALSGLVACTVLLVQVAPHARQAGMILAAQDDPAVLSELKLDTALARNPAVIQDNIEAALTCLLYTSPSPRD